MTRKHFLFTDEQLEMGEHVARVMQSIVPVHEVRKIMESDEPFHRIAWQALADQGWLSMVIPERHGGSGLGMMDLCPVAYEISRTLAPVPFFGHVCLATQALCLAGSEQQQQDYLPRFADGSVLATLAFREPGQDDWRQLPAAQVKDGRISGKYVAVPHGQSADLAILRARDGDAGMEGSVSLFLVDLGAAGISRIPAEVIDPGLAFATLKFEQVAVERLHQGPLPQGVFDQIIYSATVVDAFMQLGGADAAFARAQAYAHDRFAFGRPIGSFQAIRHKLARMYEVRSIARANCDFAAWAISQQSHLLGLAAASAHRAACEAFNHCARDNNRIHGGISATWEHDCHLFYRRAMVASLHLGNSQSWNNVLVDNLLANGADLSVDLSSAEERAANARLREECRDWIAQNRPPLSELKQLSEDEKFEFILNWHRLKAKAGWACPQWPEQHGGKGWTPGQQAIWFEEEGDTLRDLSFGLSIMDIAGPVLMKFGTTDQQQRYLPKMLSGEEFWCMLFSEPHGGSDVAALRTRAIRDGDDWLITGQKIWTSNAHHSDWGLLIARTDATVPKHHGLTYFLLDMHAPGVTVRPIRQITNNSEFCEVFLDEVRIPDSNRLGAVGGGWKIIMATLASEKAALRIFQLHLKRLLNALDDLRMNGQPATNNSLVREKIAQFTTRYWALRFIEFRNLHGAYSGQQPGQEEAVSKLIVAASNLDMAAFAMELFNDQCFRSGEAKSEELKFFEYAYFHFVGVSMGGGTEEILLNLIADYLGLPPEPRLDKDVPFNQLRTGTSA